MYLRRCYRAKDGKRHAYWALVKSVRTGRGPRQEVVAYLGEMDEAGRLGIKAAAQSHDVDRQGLLFPAPARRLVAVDTARVRVENARAFGGFWLGVPAAAVNEARLYRALDQLLPHKVALEKHLKARLGELFGLNYDLLLYDVTSTYFEGQAKASPQAQRGYSRDNRSDCKQVCIALVVSRCGMPIGYELFAGNKADVTTVQQIVTTMEERYGQARRIWVMDRGMVSQANIEFLKQGGRRYIVGTPKSMLRQYDKQLTASDWHVVREGLEVKLCPDPDGGSETFILCRSADRAAKEQAMHQRFQKRIEEGLTALAKLAANRTLTAVALALACRPAAGPEHAGGGLVPDGDRHRRRPRRLKMAEGGSVADVGELE